MRPDCEICGSEGEVVLVAHDHDSEPEKRVLCMEHQLAEVDLGAVSITPVMDQ